MNVEYRDEVPGPTAVLGGVGRTGRMPVGKTITSLEGRTHFAVPRCRKLTGRPHGARMLHSCGCCNLFAIGP